jgi:hypothetical protein
VQSVIVSVVSVVVGGSLAGATMVGLVKSETDPPSKSPVDSSQEATFEYGSTN